MGDMSTSKKLFSQNLFLLVFRGKDFVLVFKHSGIHSLVLLAVGQPLMGSLLQARPQESRLDHLTGGAMVAPSTILKSCSIDQPSPETPKTYQESQDLRKLGRIKKISILDRNSLLSSLLSGNDFWLYLTPILLDFS